MSYKEDHETFVSNLAGSDIWSILLCIAHVPVLTLLIKYLQTNSSSLFVVDFLVYCFPLVLVVTIWSNYAYWTFMTLLLFSILAYRSKLADLVGKLNGSFNSVVARNTYYLTLFKGANVFVTCVAILAVDFKVFPREYGKTETFGVSLMDAGVGSFIISSAITSKYARGVTVTKSKETSSFNIPYQKLFVLMLGVGRMVILKAINYQEHVSEYGVHWNFFVTLFCVWTVADCVHYLSDDRVRVALMSLCHLLVYQMALLHTPLTEYLMSSQRDTLVAANKEGLFSLNGYIPLYLLTECIAYYVFFNEGKLLTTGNEKCSHPHHQTTVKSDYSTSSSMETVVLDCQQCDSHAQSVLSSPFNRMVLVSVVSWLLWIVCAGLAQPTSRRLVNMAYCSLSVALSLSTVSALFIVETLTSSGSARPVPVRTPEYMSKHSLMVFLLANLMTGLVNKVFQTIHMDTTSAMAVLCGYCLYLAAVAWGSEAVFGSSKRS